MVKKLLVITKDQHNYRDLSSFLLKHQYQPQRIECLEDLEPGLKSALYQTTILDLDSICLDNQAVRAITLRHPGVYFLCISKDRFHPELKDAICYHIYACLKKPLDWEELLYWLRCIEDNGMDAGAGQDGVS